MFGWYPTRASSSVSTKVKVDAKKLNDSVYELHKPPGNPSVQIVFFHGLYTGDSSDAHVWTWESEDGSCVWPATWLVEEFPAAHVFSVSYCGSVGKSSQGRLDMHNIGENLISDLMHANIGQTPYCPVILVGYCFGGLVIKELCCQLSLGRNLIKFEGERKKLETFLDNLRGVFYYGTPHSGSPLIDKVTLVVESPLLEYFSTLSKDASRLNHRFDQLYRASNWRVDGLGENLPAKVGIFKGIVVASETSARGGDLFNVLPVEHLTICKPSSKKDKRFYALTNLLHSVAENQEAAHKCQGLPRYPIDLERRAREVQEKLMTGEVVGLVGMGGVGKTTLARQVFNYISREFEYTCFVESVKGIPLHEFENSILSGFHQSGRRMDRPSWSDLKGKTLIIMDDVDSVTQLQMLPALQSFGKGSRLVVTSRDESIFSCLESFDLYNVDFLNDDQAKKLFCLYADLEEALGDSAGTSLLEKNMKAVVDKCRGLPLTLEVIGCYLRGRATDVTYWKDTLRKLGKAQSITGSGNDRVWNTLKVSYDSLAPREQKMFIEASIHFFGEPVDRALAAWEGAYKTSKTEWENLIRRSLVKVSTTQRGYGYLYPFDDEHKTVWVHEHLRDLATSLSKGYMVRGRGESATSRCLNELNTNDVKANAKIVSIRGSSVPLQLNSVAKLKKLRCLDLKSVQPEGSFENFPGKLSLLRWQMRQNTWYLFPSCSHTGMRNLAVLELENWSICKEFPQLLGSLTNLRILSLCNLRGLDHLPENFGNLSGLEKLELRKLNVQALPSSFGRLSSLRELTLDLPQLKCLPDNICQLQCLTKLIIGSRWASADSLQTLPDNLGLLSCLEILRIRSRKLRQLPKSLGELAQLKTLILDVDKVKVLPATVGQLSLLREVSLTLSVHCLPESILQLSSLRTLKIVGRNLKNLPDCFTNLCSLESLEIECASLESLPESVGCLSSLRKCVIESGSLRRLPDSIGHLCALQSFTVKCQNLEKLPESFGLLSALQNLTLEIGQSTYLPDTVFRFRVLKKLVIRRTGQSSDKPDRDSLETLLDKLGPLLSLERLEIKCPFLKMLPDSLGWLTRLEVLSLEVEAVKVLPESVGQLSALRELKFISAVDYLPESLGQLSSLKALHVASKNLAKLPDSLQNLSSLETLGICSNNLESLPESIVRLSSLKRCSIASKILRLLPKSIVEMSAFRKLSIRPFDIMVFNRRYISPGTLSIFSDSLDRLPESIGQSLHLTIESSDLKSLPDSIEHWSALRSMTIKCRRLEKVPDGLGLLSALEELTLEIGQSKVLPENLCQLQTLKKLVIIVAGEHSDNVDKDGLEMLLDNLGLLTCLEHLTIKCPSLKMLPDSLGELTRLETLCLDVRAVKVLPATVGQLSALREFDFTSAVDYLPESLGQLSSLKRLSVRSENLVKLPDSFQNLCSLETLKIVSNILESLPESTGRLYSLKRCSIKSERLRSLPDSIGQLSLLHNLSVRSENLEKLPDSFQKLCSLEKFSIVAKCLVCIPECVGLLSSLTRCSVVSEALRSLPESMGQLSALQDLTIKCLHLDKLPDSLGNLASLRYCSVVSEALRSLPESMGQLSALEVLTIKCLNLEKLPDSLGNLASLRRLFVYGKSAVSLPESIGRLSLLASLILESGSWTSVPSSLLSTVGQLSGLWSLVIRGVTLEKLPDGLGELTALKYLTIHARSLAIIPDSIGRLSSLERLTVESKSLRSLPSSVGNLSALKTLIVWCNNLEKLPDTFGDLSSLTKLFVRESGEERFQETKKQLSSWGWIPLPVEDAPRWVKDKKWWFQRK